MDYKYIDNAFYKICKNGTIEEITSFEYENGLLNILQTSYNNIYGDNSIEYKELMNSVYPPQRNDYFLLTIPHSNKRVPVDAKLKNLVKYLWGNNLTTYGSNEPYKHRMGFISFDNNLFILSTLKKTFLRDYIIHDHTVARIYGNSNNNYVKWMNMIATRWGNKIHIEICNRFIFMYFTDEKLKWIYNKLELPQENLGMARKGINYCIQNV